MATQTIHSSKEGYIYQRTPDEVRSGLYIEADSGSQKKAQIAFDISTAPEGSKVTQVLLYLLRAEDNVFNPIDVDINRITDSWDPATLTWNNAPTITTVNGLVDVELPDRNAWESYDITNIYKDGSELDELGVRIEEQRSGAYKGPLNILTSNVAYINIIYEPDCPDPYIEAIDFSPASPKVGEEVSFWKTGDGGGEGHYIESRDWNFGDGSTHGTTSNARHTYDTVGDYTVRYTVTNDCGESKSKSKVITVVDDCPDPTVIITNTSNYTPESGEQVDFTGYASGGTGESIQSKSWNFGDGTSSNELNPSKTWTNTTGENKEYTVTFTATNTCGKPGSSSETITVASVPAKTGIEIQFPESMNGKELIVYGAIPTVCGLWWGGPAVHGLIWTKGRCKWEDINSSKKYNILVGEACQERASIDDVVPEHPDMCAGEFVDGDIVVILIRNPGFDFRVYSANDVYTLTDSSFSVLYLSETSEDIVSKVFTGWICGIIGLEAGSECDMFWAEFYDPLFVANYLSIQKTGKDIVGNERELGWLDHVAFVASLVGSLPAFNLFPFAGTVKSLGRGIKPIINKTLAITDLLSSELQDCGRAMADICLNAPKVIQNLIPEELTRLREAMVKVFGEVDGNKYIDDALIVTSKLFDEAFAIVSKDTVTIQELAKFDTLLTSNSGLGTELGDHYLRVLLGHPPHPATPSAEDLNAIRNHARSVHTKDVINVWDGSGVTQRAKLGEHSRIYQLMDRDYVTLKEAFGDNRAVSWVRSQGNIADSVAHAADKPDADRVARSMSDFVFDWETIAKIGKKTDEEMEEAYLVAADVLEDTPVTEWRAETTKVLNAHVTDLSDELLPGGATDNSPPLMKAWAPTPAVTPATVDPIPDFTEWLDDVPTIDAFATMVGDAAKTTVGLADDDLATAGAALARMCTEADGVVKHMTPEAVVDLRAALIKIYGDVDGNKYVDDALAAGAKFVSKYYDILENFRTGAITKLPTGTIDDILSHGQTTPEELIDLIVEFESKGTIDGLCTKLMEDAAEYPTGSTFQTLSSKRNLVEPDTVSTFTANHCNVAEKATAATDPIKTMSYPEDAQSFPFDFRTIADEVDEPISTNLNEVIEKFAESDTGKWRDKGMRYLNGKVLGWFSKITTKKQKTIRFPDAPGRYRKWKNIYDNLEDWQKFTTMSMLVWGTYETISWVGTYIIPKWFGFFPEQAAFRQRQHNDNMEAASWLCKSAHDYERIDLLLIGIGIMRVAIAEAEEHLDHNKIEFETADVYAGFAHAIVIAKAQLEIAEAWLGDATPTGFIKCTSNVDFFYVELEDEPAGFSYQSQSILLKSVPIGTHKVKIYKHNVGECIDDVTVTEGDTAEFDCQMLATEECPEVEQVKISVSPSMVKLGDEVEFTATAVSDEPIAYYVFDFGNGVKNTPSDGVNKVKYTYPKAGTYQASVTAHNDCGEHGITYSLAKVIVTVDNPVIPDPDPGTDEAGTLLVEKPVNAQNNIECSRAWDAEIFVDGVKMSGGPPLTIQFGTNKYVGSYGGECGTHEIKVRLADYQDVKESWTINDGDDKTWTPRMYLDDYVPPVDSHSIDIYIPEGASITRPTKVTGISRIVTGMRRIGGR